MKNAQSVLIAFLGGAIAGAAVALLFAPESGAETRRRIKAFAEDEQGKIKGVFNALRGKAVDAGMDGLDELEEEVEGIEREVKAAKKKLAKAK